MKINQLLAIILLLSTVPMRAEASAAEDPVAASLIKFIRDPSVHPLKHAEKLLNEKVAKLSAIQKLESYQVFVTYLAEIYDPRYDTNRPVSYMDISVTRYGFVYEEGTTLEEIKDPIIRANYQRMLAENLANSRFNSFNLAIIHTIENLSLEIRIISSSKDLNDVDRKRFIDSVKKTILPDRFKNIFLIPLASKNPE